MASLVHIHIGSVIPTCLYDSLFQTLLINNCSNKIYVILDDVVIPEFKRTIDRFALDQYCTSTIPHTIAVQTIPISILKTHLESNPAFQRYQNIISKKYQDIDKFREGFWVSTTSRFFFIHAFMQMFNMSNIFHIENDIMMYETFSNILSRFGQHSNKMWMVQDAPDRVVPSILFFPNDAELYKLTEFITNSLQESNSFLNDMNILGRFPDKFNLPLMDSDIMFDGAAIGQYLGGIDTRNFNNGGNAYENTTVGFVNETSVFKPNTCQFSNMFVQTDDNKVPIKIVTCSSSGNLFMPSKLSVVANLHIHSKQLYGFSSIFNIRFNDIISGDRILGLCDFVIATKDIYQFHKNIERYAKDVILIRNWENIQFEQLNSYFREHASKCGSNTIRLFIYTHILQNFVDLILDNLDKSLDYVIYLHNSDHPFSDQYTKLVEKPYIKHVYAQNVDFKNSEKVTLLPIGIANSMWTHGDLNTLYQVMIDTYKNQKLQNVYVNINPNTFGYRKVILDQMIKDKTFVLSSSKPYKEYLTELANHMFCLCLRGNGIDTHRFWESLYLGVIPVIINNSKTNCKNFVNYLRNTGIPFYEITDEDMSKYTSEYFNKELYLRILERLGKSIFHVEELKLSHYQNFSDNF
jgi:hypothetical protein